MKIIFVVDVIGFICGRDGVCRDIYLLCELTDYPEESQYHFK
jgi:hypothetical protein